MGPHLGTRTQLELKALLSRGGVIMGKPFHTSLGHKERLAWFPQSPNGGWTGCLRLYFRFSLKARRFSFLFFNRFIQLALIGATVAHEFGYRQAHAQQPRPLKAGSYRCFTTAFVSASTPNPRDADWRKANGLPPLERGQRATPPRVTAPVPIQPAFFGNIVLDDKGSYQLTRSGHTGKVGFDAQTGKPTFTGDLEILKIEGYDSQVFRFFLVYQSLAFECGLEGPTTTPVPAPVAPPPSPNTNKQQQEPVAPAKQSDYAGHFEGILTCKQKQAPIQLDTKASPNGLLVAVFTFGGLDGNDPDGRFTLAGKWTPEGFQLNPHEWVNPLRDQSMFGLTGKSNERGIAAEVTQQNCSGLELVRKQTK